MFVIGFLVLGLGCSGVWCWKKLVILGVFDDENVLFFLLFGKVFVFFVVCVFVVVVLVVLVVDVFFV